MSVSGDGSQPSMSKILLGSYGPAGNPSETEESTSKVQEHPGNIEEHPSKIQRRTKGGGMEIDTSSNLRGYPA